MALILQEKITSVYSEKKQIKSLWKRFINWADSQEEHRFGWTAFAIAGHGCVFTILTVLAIILAGNSFVLWPFAIGAMAACLIANLSAMPTKITIPVLFASLIVDITIIAICISQGLDLTMINP